MALPARPEVVDRNGELVYHSLDAIDQALFDGLTNETHRSKFVEMVYRLREEDANAVPSDGQAIANKWRSSGTRLRKLRATLPIAVQAIPPLQVQVALPSPPQSPLAELSPRFACQADGTDVLLSPTKGQAEFIANNLGEPWKFADVIYQDEPTPLSHRIPLAPTTSVFLFVRSDDDGRINDQLVVKCLDVTELAGDRKDSTLTTANAAVEREVNMSQLIELTQCSHVTKYRGHSVRPSEACIIRPTDDGNLGRRYVRKTVHIYQDFAGRGDLQHLIDCHKEKKKPINEHFIWYTLQELTEALIALHRGPKHCSNPHEPADELPASDEYSALPVKPWLPILHLDIKTENVFLEATNADYPAYPKPVLADFGVSCRVTENAVELKHCDGSPEHIPRFAGTTGWHPPERHDGALINDGQGLLVDPNYVPHTWRLTERTDIWALGLIAHKMMYAHRTDTVEIRNPDDTVTTVSVEEHTLSKEGTWKDELREREIAEHESHFDASAIDLGHLPDGYSARLCLLAAQCLRHDIEARPGLETLLTICRTELARLDNLPSASAGKRKRDKDDNEDELTLLTSKKFSKYENGNIYQPKRQRTKVDLGDTHAFRAAYTQLIDAWPNMSRPTAEAQNKIIDAIDWCLVDYEDGHPMTRDSEVYSWSVKHLVSCLRKRISPKNAAYFLTGEYIEENQGNDWIELTFEPEIKIKILEYFLTLDDEFWNNPSILEGDGSQDALEALETAVQWGLMILRDTVTPVVTDASGTPSGGNPAEPREPRMANQSALHKGIYDWIFVRPAGAFYKN